RARAAGLAGPAHAHPHAAIGARPVAVEAARARGLIRAAAGVARAGRRGRGHAHLRLRVASRARRAADVRVEVAGAADWLARRAHAGTRVVRALLAVRAVLAMLADADEVEARTGSSHGNERRHHLPAGGHVLHRRASVAR